jgi:hypothetical protein
MRWRVRKEETLHALTPQKLVELRFDYWLRYFRWCRLKPEAFLPAPAFIDLFIEAAKPFVAGLEGGTKLRILAVIAEIENIAGATRDVRLSMILPKTPDDRVPN